MEVLRFCLSWSRKTCGLQLLLFPDIVKIANIQQQKEKKYVDSYFVYLWNILIAKKIIARILLYQPALMYVVCNAIQ